MEHQDSKNSAGTTNQVLPRTIAIICFLGFAVQCVLAAKIIVVDLEFATLGLCLLFAVLFAIGFFIAAPTLPNNIVIKITLFLLSAITAGLSVLWLLLAGAQIAVGISIGLFTGAICTCLPFVRFFVLPTLDK